MLANRWKVSKMITPSKDFLPTIRKGDTEMYQTIAARFYSFIDSLSFSQEEKEIINVLKLEHTLRVVELSEILAKSVFDENDSEGMNTAKIIGVLHDIGRWQQMHNRSLSDTDSDHGEMGVALIIENNILDGIPENTQHIILTAIREHNKKYSDEFDGMTQMFVDIIRDADKIDNFFVEVKDYANNPLEKSMQKVLPFSDEHRLSHDIYDCIMNNRLADSSARKTKIDFKFFKMAWCYDIKLAKSMEIIREKQYIHDIFNDIQNPDKAMIQAYEKICAYLMPTSL